MAYVGLVPSESSSGGRTRRGGSTKAGNHHARRVLIEGAWDLPLCGQAQSRAPCPQRRAAQGGTRHRLEGAAAPVRPIPASPRRRQAQGRGHHRGRPRDGRVRLGDRLSGATKTGRLNRPRHPAGKGDRNPTTDNFASGHGRRRAAVGNPPSRYEPICDRRSLWSEAAPSRNHGHAAPTRASEFAQPSSRRPPPAMATATSHRPLQSSGDNHPCENTCPQT